MSCLDDLLDQIEGYYQEPTAWALGGGFEQRYIYQDMDAAARQGCEDALHDRSTYEEEDE